MAVCMRSGEARRLAVVHAQTGFTLLAVLMAMLLLALVTQRVVSVVSHQVQREREAELLRVGAELAQAIGAYYERTPGTVKTWPPSLEVLIDDKRFVTLERHLRRVYPDPITRSDDWGIVPAPGGGIAGVYSKSDARPIQAAGYELADWGLGPATRYSEWKFIYRPKPAGDAGGGRP